MKAPGPKEMAKAKEVSRILLSESSKRLEEKLALGSMNSRLVASTSSSLNCSLNSIQKCNCSPRSESMSRES